MISGKTEEEGDSMKKVFSVFFLLSCFIRAAFAENIGFIDLDKILMQSKEGKKIKTQFDKEAKVKQEEIKKLEDAIKKKIETFNQKKFALKPEGQKQEEENIQMEILRGREITQKYMQDMQLREKELLSPLVERVRKIIENISEKEGYSFVFEKQSSFIIYSKPQYDLTDRVIKIINEGK